MEEKECYTVSWIRASLGEHHLSKTTRRSIKSNIETFVLSTKEDAALAIKEFIAPLPDEVAEAKDEDIEEKYKRKDETSTEFKKRMKIERKRWAAYKNALKALNHLKQDSMKKISFVGLFYDEFLGVVNPEDKEDIIIITRSSSDAEEEEDMLEFEFKLIKSKIRLFS